MIDVVPLGADTAGELLTLQRAAYLEQARAHQDLDMPPLTETLDAVRAAIGGAGGVRVFGVRDAGRLVATVRLRPLLLGQAAAALGADDGEAALEVGRLAVVPDLQGHGLGTAMLRHCEAVACDDGVGWLVLFTGERSSDNLRLYARHGYQVTHHAPSGAGYDLVHLARPARLRRE